jgi:signal transduction histidine kinase
VAAAAPRASLLGGFTGVEFVGIVLGGVCVAALVVALTHAFALGCTAIARGLLAPDERALLAARVSELETTRAAAVESADARLRRLERDLHDGAQHRLAYIAMELDRARL